MQFKVPQNIDMQDKILGPLTLFQLLFLLIGFLVVYSIIRSGSVILTVLVAAPIGLLTLALAFVKVNEQPFIRFLSSLVVYLFKPKVRLWHKGGAVPKVTVAPSQQIQKTRVAPKKLDPEKIAQVANKLDQP